MELGRITDAFGKWANCIYEFCDMQDWVTTQAAQSTKKKPELHRSMFQTLMMRCSWTHACKATWRPMPAGSWLRVLAAKGLEKAQAKGKAKEREKGKEIAFQPCRTKGTSIQRMKKKKKTQQKKSSWKMLTRKQRRPGPWQQLSVQTLRVAWEKQTLLEQGIKAKWLEGPAALGCHGQQTEGSCEERKCDSER